MPTKVRDAIRIIEDDGWFQLNQVAAAVIGSSSRNVQQHSETGRSQVNMHRFLIIIEDAGENHSAYSPDLPGCVATGATREDAEQNMYAAIQMHIEGLREDGLPIPPSGTLAEYVVVGA